MAKSPKPALPDLRSAKPRANARGLTLLAYDAATQKIVPVSIDAVLNMAKPQPNPNPIPTPNLSDDQPLAEDDGVVLATDQGAVLAGDIRK